MSELATSASKKRPEFRNINAFTDLPSYRLPLAGIVSILHRISGLIMFLLMPFIIWMFDTSISSEISFAKFTSAFNVGMLGLPGVIWTLVALLLTWAYLHHLIRAVAQRQAHGFRNVGHLGAELDDQALAATIVRAGVALRHVPVRPVAHQPLARRRAIGVQQLVELH